MPPVPGPVRKDRAARLRDAGTKVMADYTAGFLNETVRVLVEKGKQGLTDHYVPARINGDANPGDIVIGDVTAIEGGGLVVLPTA